MINWNPHSTFKTNILLTGSPNSRIDSFQTFIVVKNDAYFVMITIT